MRTETDEPGFPSTLSLIGTDDNNENYYTLYFNERCISRKFEVQLKENSGNCGEMYQIFHKDSQELQLKMKIQ